ncbi:MAG: hypothetical protein LCH47_11175 [Proteobacteria bacterium]|nr:hypothetical protein [Pseudomonadota bacterium]
MADLSKLLCAAVRRNLERGGRPVIPAGGELLWRWFNDMHSARSSGMNGPNPISFEAVAAYARLNRWAIEPRHVSILQAMDREVMEYFRRSRQSGPPGVKALPPISDRPISAAVLDAMFG